LKSKTFIDQLSAHLLALGVRPGGVLLVHSSLKSLGPVEGGAGTVIDGLLAALGEEGTLLMPALTYERVTPENPVFDVMLTPANVGIIPETFRRRKSTSRSIHPTHSVCGTGPLTQVLLAPHFEDNTPCGKNSPFHKLPEIGGQILMLGCGLEPNTSMHAIEELVEPVYLYDPPVEYELIMVDNSTLRKSYTPHNFHGWVQRYDRVSEILTPSELHSGRILEAKAYLIDAVRLWERTLPAMKRDPLYFVEQRKEG
jgi:aminoglycoside 3-N-acetyltransferase